MRRWRRWTASLPPPTGERHPADLAMLRGARLVAAQEAEHGRRWNEARIKTLSGGDAVTARTMRGDFFTYRPGFKLFITGNRKPELSCVDEAIRRRFNLVPFAVTIADPDPALPRKLEAEWPGILAWMIEGCREWQRIGLAPPEAVTAATAAYLAEEDTFGGWLDECVHAALEGTATSADLFASWASYAAAAQEPVGSTKAFSHALQARGFARCRIGHAGTNGFKGIRLRVPLGKSLPAGTFSGRPAASDVAPATLDAD
jgi:putative DNA primase/helicase